MQIFKYANKLRIVQENNFLKYGNYFLQVLAYRIFWVEDPKSFVFAVQIFFLEPIIYSYNFIIGKHYTDRLAGKDPE